MIAPGEIEEIPIQFSSRFLEKRKSIAIYWKGENSSELLREISLDIDGDPVARSIGLEGGGEFFPGTVLQTRVLFSDGFSPAIDEVSVTLTKGIDSELLDFQQVGPNEYLVEVIVNSLSGSLSGEVEIQLPIKGKLYSGLVYMPYSFSSGWHFSASENLANQPTVKLSFAGSDSNLSQFSAGESSWGAPAICDLTGTYSWSMALFGTGTANTHPAVSLFHNGEQFSYPLPIGDRHVRPSSSARLSFEFH